MSTTAKQLIEAATNYKNWSLPHGHPEKGFCDWLLSDVETARRHRDDACEAMAEHILSTVRPDDDEPVTRERLEADENWVMVDTDVYYWKDRYGVMTSYHVTLTQQYSSLLWSSTGVVVRKVKSMGHLRRLVAALGE